ncbi:MAG TPA: aliphatic sulfonate ABC transporter substrate-binding protein, partial [Devosia sp.]|nr:aliphatic sulfonate ABC transporter substrate-binding protein [Devosia sp.]
MKTGLRRRSILGLVAAAIIAATTATPAVVADEIDTIRFGYIADFNGAYALAVADKLGLWDKFGIKAEPFVFTNGPLQIQAIQTRDLDTASIGPGALWLAATGKAKVISINGVGLADRIIALPGSGIDSIADLKGKRIGVPAGTSGDMILQLTLAKAGLTSTDVELLNMDPSTLVSATSAGQVDAAAIWYPLVQTIRESQPEITEIASSRDFYPENTFPGTIVVGNEYAAENGPALIKLLKVLQAANDYREANMEEVIQWTADYVKVDAAIVRSNAENILYPSTAELVEQSSDGTAAK